MKTMDWLYRLCRWTLGGIFIYAGSTKLLEPEIFAVLIEAYGIVPERLLMPVAIGLPSSRGDCRVRTAVRYPREPWR
jgi:uncharacterized membrane protein YphA (DoxX/SURF4 family)